MLKLVERDLVKDLLRLPRADTMQDRILSGLIGTVSQDVERLTRRAFEKKQRVEYRQSYDQAINDPEPQWVLVDAYPIDTVQPITVEYSPSEWRPAGSIITLDATKADFTVEAETGKITVRNASTYIYNGFYPQGGWLFSYAPRGFRVTYTGGYAISAAPDGHTADPLDDFGVIQVDDSLKLVVANAVAAKYRFMRGNAEKLTAAALDEAFRLELKPFMKKDMV
jgi:hypothetical protein